MGNFFDGLDRQHEPNLLDCVSCLASDYQTANVEKVLVALEQMRTSPDNLLNGWADKWKTNLPLLKRELSSYILRRLKQGLDISDDNWAANLLAGFSPATTVISMNYNNIAERILSCVAHSDSRRQCPHCRMRELLEKACNCDRHHQDFLERDWRGALIKPHGSIAWRRCVNPGCCAYECLVADAHCRPFEPCRCPSCGQFCEPVLVMPTMSKNLSEMPEIATMWNTAKTAIADAESIALFGFSMPTSDELLIQMFRSAISSKRKLRRVAAIDLIPDSVLARFADCVPKDCEVEYSRFTVTPGEYPVWLGQFERNGRSFGMVA